ncbi:MAG: dual specificity protein phosphatase family protein [Candidatus Eremiobacteraeota bacterium]|nr:dual specificity protein phosphatase family protein [Candidatus Eremiobacteraeota bacterium]
MDRSSQPNLAIHHVCGLDELHRAPLASADRIVSILDPGAPLPFELRSVAVPLLVLRFEDVTNPADSLAPQRADVEQLVAFDADAREEDRLVVHCTAGISRSTAALAILLAARHPELNDEIFAAIREIRPTAWPNALLVAHGDEALRRGGSLRAALRRHYQFQAEHPVYGLLFRGLTQIPED